MTAKRNGGARAEQMGHVVACVAPARTSWKACRWGGRPELSRAVALLLIAAVPCAPALRAQEAGPVELTLESAVAMAMEQSYSVRQLQMGIDQTRSLLKAERARLKTRIDLELSAPQFEAISDYEWNSDLGRNELVRENSRRWEANLSVRQPVILFGYPTNGYLSLNTRLYRDTQLQGDEPFTRYYNRYFIAYEQPLFEPNDLRYELREAELELEEAGLEFQENVVELIDDIADEYYELFGVAYERVIYSELVSSLERAAEVAQAIVRSDSSRTVDATQIQVELANAQERLQQARSEYRISASSMKQRLRIDPSDSLVVRPELAIQPVLVDLERAIQYGTTLRPSLRGLEIERWNDEVELEQTRAFDSFRLELELTYGREMLGADLGTMWDEPRNSYTVSVNADVPIWDWGARDARIQAATIGVRQTELAIEETRAEIRAEVTTAVENLEVYRQRAADMQQNLELAAQLSETSLARYAVEEVTTLELLRSFDRQVETATNFLDTYLGYRRALLELQELTYYDFERDAPVLERFGAATLPSR